MRYIFINMDNVEFEIEPSMALDDGLLKTNLGVHDPSLANATFSRTLSQDGETTYVRAMVQGAGKGNANVRMFFETLVILPESKNPIIKLLEDIEKGVNIHLLQKPEILALEGLIERKIIEGDAEAKRIKDIITRLRECKGSPSSTPII